MSKMIQIRNVSEETHRVFKARAAEAGMSLSDYIKRDLELAAQRPTMEEFNRHLRAHGVRSDLTAKDILSVLDEIRGQ